jgi:hypothetical protein
MKSDIDEVSPDMTIVGGQPPKRRHRYEGKISVPVGLEKLLYLAADDPSFRRRLLDDWRLTVEAAGVSLRPSERAILETGDRDMLARMIDGIVPANPKRRKFMGLVAAAVTSLAAGTAGCIDTDSTNYGVDAGVGPDLDADTDTDTDDGGLDSGDTDTVDTDDPGTGVDAGVNPDPDSGEY